MFAYNRSCSEIEDMLERAVDMQTKWRKAFLNAQQYGDREIMKDAARNSKALDGVIKTLRWTLGEDGIVDPLS